MAGGWVRLGCVYRSASLSKVTPPDDGVLLRKLGIRVVVDLRSEREVERDGCPGALERRVRWVSCPMDDPDDTLRRSRHPAPSQYAAHYRRLVLSAGPPLQTILDAVGAPRPEPVLFCCTAGKDRTGVVAALLLLLLGATDRIIASDYALTARALRGHLDRFQDHWQRKDLTAQQYSARLETVRPTMLSLTRWLRERFPSGDDLAAALALRPGSVAAARNALVTSTAPFAVGDGR